MQGVARVDESRQLGQKFALRCPEMHAEIHSTWLLKVCFVRACGPVFRHPDGTAWECPAGFRLPKSQNSEHVIDIPTGRIFHTFHASSALNPHQPEVPPHQRGLVKSAIPTLQPGLAGPYPRAVTSTLEFSWSDFLFWTKKNGRVRRESLVLPKNAAYGAWR